MTLDLTDPNAFRDSIRYDPLTKRGSVLDVVQLVTQAPCNNASRNYASILEKFPDFRKEITYFKFSGQGQRPTPVATLPVLFRIMISCPGSRAREFGRSSIDVFTRAFGGDETLANEIVQRKDGLAGTDFQDAAAGITTTVDDAMACLSAPLEPSVDTGVLYIATSSLLPFFKLGYWTGSHDKLRSRFAVYYGPYVELHTWKCTECRECESFILKEFQGSSMGGELFDKTCMSDVIAILDMASNM